MGQSLIRNLEIDILEFNLKKKKKSEWTQILKRWVGPQLQYIRKGRKKKKKRNLTRFCTAVIGVVRIAQNA